jgi:putative component of toxin-antitoxin plasmid stabilization module
MVYSGDMLDVVKSATFDAWLSGLRDRRAKARIAVRIDRLARGNPDGPGYRVYFMQRGTMLVVILCGGDKRTQSADIKLAMELAKSWKG